MEINLIYDSSVNGAPGAFKTALNSAAQYLDSEIANQITVNIDVGYGEDDGQTLSPDESSGGPTAGISLTYSQLKSELTANATSTIAAAAIANLPEADPTNGGVFEIAPAQEKAWGLLPASGTEIDGTVGFSSSVPYNYNPNDRAATLPNPGASWTAVGMGDFNEDGHSDILWQNTDGTPDIWLMDGDGILGGGELPNPGPSWLVAGTGDFNGNGYSDILWQNTNGAPDIWLMNGTNIVGGAMLPNPGTSWHVVATSDFNGDGKSDILWQNTNGTPVVWLMNGTNIVGAATLPDPGPSWNAIAVGDFQGNGQNDILWQNANGTPEIWLMNGTNVVGAATLPNPGLSWAAVAVGDFTGNGSTDILWQNVNGTPDIWLMNGTNVLNSVALPDPGPSWGVILNGDSFFASSLGFQASSNLPSASQNTGLGPLTSTDDTAMPAISLRDALAGINPSHDLVPLSAHQAATFAEQSAPLAAGGVSDVLHPYTAPILDLLHDHP